MTFSIRSPRIYRSISSTVGTYCGYCSVTSDTAPKAGSHISSAAFSLAGKNIFFIPTMTFTPAADARFRRSSSSRQVAAGGFSIQTWQPARMQSAAIDG